jgi:hypothetical protein
MNNRVIVKRDPPEHGFGLWPGYGKVAGKVLILDLGKGPTKILILLDSVPVWLRARASNRLCIGTHPHLKNRSLVLIKNTGWPKLCQCS